MSLSTLMFTTRNPHVPLPNVIPPPSRFGIGSGGGGVFEFDGSTRRMDEIMGHVRCVAGDTHTPFEYDLAIHLLNP